MNLSNLPDSAQHLVNILGMDAAMALIEAHGGTRLYVPTLARLTPEHPLSALLGYAAARKLCDALSGPELRVPLCPQIKRAVAVAEFMAGVPASILARRFKTTETTIWRWVKAADAQRCNRTPDMFEEIGV
jgi:hypothetical protein